jgi:hypothetical protein
MIEEKRLETHPRQSGKTASLKLRAIELYNNYCTVIFILHNERAAKETERYFKSIGMKIKCTTLNDANIHFVNTSREMPPEYKLVNNGVIYILLDEYSLMDQNKLNSFTNQCKVSNKRFHISGKTTKP